MADYGTAPGVGGPTSGFPYPTGAGGYGTNPGGYSTVTGGGGGPAYPSYGGAPSAPAKPAITAGGPGSFGPDITLGPDGNVYGYSRQYDSATNSYSYTYKNLGPATDLTAVSAASGLPVGMLQAVVQQQQVQLNNLAVQGEVSPYYPSMTNQQLTQTLDKLRTAQQYQSALAMQGVSTNGLTYAQMQDAYNQSSAAFNYATQGTAQQAQGYNWQRANDQGANYNTASGVNGQTWGQLGISNENSQAQQQYAYGQNYGAVNPYSGLSNGQTGLQASNVQNAYNLTQGQYNISNQTADNQLRDINRTYDTAQGRYNLANQTADQQLRDLNRTYDTTAQQYNLGTAAYTNGQTRQQYQQGTQDTQNQYNRSDSTYRLAHQGNQQALDTYNEMSKGLQDQKLGQSRNLTGLGWAGIQKPVIAGY